MALQDDLLKHRIFALRLARGKQAVIVDAAKKAARNVLQTISIPNYLESPNSKAQLVQNVRSVLLAALPELLLQYSDFAEYEAGFLLRLFRKYFNKNVQGLVNAKAVAKAAEIRTSLGKNGFNVKKSYELFVNKKAEDIVNAGYEEEPEKNMSLIVQGLIAYQAYNLARTVIANHSTTLQDALQKANKDIISGKWQWIATLDNTCAYCEDKHEEIFDIGDEAPPAHVNCNCIIVPVGND